MTDIEKLLADAEDHFKQGIGLIAQARKVAADQTADVLDPKDAARVAKVGEVAHRHLALIETNGKITVADSREIRRDMYGDKIQSTANLFGTENSGALFYRPVPHGTPTLPSQEVRLTEEGIRIATLWRDLNPTD